MGTLYEGSFTGGWNLIAGEEIPGLDTPDIEDDLPLYKRGPLAARPVPMSVREEIDNKVLRAESETRMFDAFRVAGESLGLSPEAIADLFAEIVKPIPEPTLSMACREDHHFAADFPEGCCMGKRLGDDYIWHFCECSCHEGQEVHLP